MEQPIWTTPAGSLGNFPSLVYVEIQLAASPVFPATNIVYELLSGSLPIGLTISETGLISGTPTILEEETQFNFAIRITDNLQSIRDRTFSLIISGLVAPKFITPEGLILSTVDSVWVEIPIQYSNPIDTNLINIKLVNGALPPGLEINESGLIRGYADKPVMSVDRPLTTTGITSTDTSNILTCLSTINFAVNRPITFSGSLFGGLTSTETYYVKEILSNTTFTISGTEDGPTITLSVGIGYMTATLPATAVDQPTIRTYSFTLLLDSFLGQDSINYSIIVINQNVSTSQGGPGVPQNARIPTIFNTRPTTFNLTDNDPYYGYYIVPAANSSENTIIPSNSAFIGTIQSNNYFSFKIIGHDFDNNNIQYSFAGLPLNLVGDVNTGWITGTPTLSIDGINNYSFSVAVNKIANPSIQTPYFNFSFNLANNIDGTITWITPTNLGTINNGTISTRSVLATSDVDLEYRIVGGSLPPNLTLLSNGEITGYVANQPTDEILMQGTSTTFTFIVQAFSTKYSIIQSAKTFNLVVVQEYNQPTDVLYCKATPSVENRDKIDSLLLDDTIIPNDVLYRPFDIYFGKATSVIYVHAYGIYANSIDEYLTTITKNHYWRNITLGEIKTAVAKDDTGEIIYEVVYSEVIDNLLNPSGTSVSEDLIWPRPIDLSLGPWYTSVTDIYTSYELVLNQEYYTSLTPGYARILYPNSLYNMRTRVAQGLGQEYASSLLPLWMTSQQLNGGTLGFTQAWVICYTKPGYAETIKNNISGENTLWKDPAGRPYKLNQINFRLDRFSVSKTITYNYDNSLSPPSWTGLPSADPVPDPLDSKDFYVLFPRKTILPDEAQ